MSNKAKPIDGIQVYKRLLSYAKPYWGIFLIAVLATIAYAGFSASFTYFIKPLMDKGFIARQSAYILWLPIVFVLIFIGRGISGFVSNYCMAYVGKSIVMAFQQEIFNKLLRLPSNYYDGATSGTLLSAIIFNTSNVSNACTNAVSMFVQNFFFAVGLLVVMMTISWPLTLILFAVAPIFIWLMRSTNKRQRRLNLKIQETMGGVTHIAEEMIEGYKVVKTFGGQQYESEKFAKVTRDNRHQALKVVVAQGINTPVVQFVGVCAMSIMVYLAASGLGPHLVTAGGFAAMVAAMLSLLRPIKTLTQVNAAIQQGLAGAESIFALLDEEEEKDTGTKIMPKQIKTGIVFENVCLQYRRSNDLVLKNINFTVEAGKTVALVGRSGAGKSSLASLLTRFYDVCSGDIKIDNASIYEYTLQSLRDQIALVTQHITLFNDTIAHNIAYGRLQSVSYEEIEQAAIKAHAMEFIKDLPQGLNTVIGENGVLLSGGQRQRIAIARAILKNAPILILDEATSALDTESERYIQAALEEVMRNRTTIVIAHRLSTIENADKIIVMDAGEIMEEGAHQELLVLNSYYAKLHKMQFGKQIFDNAVQQGAA